MQTNKIYGEAIETGALDQFSSALEQDFTVRGALMPDAHFGYTLPIGAVVATDNFILPSWVGYDIGCGMCALPLNCTPDDVRRYAEGIFKSLYEIIPVGFKHNAKPVTPNAPVPACTEKALDIFLQKKGYHQLGTLGGGNHFIEVGHDETDQVWVIIHSGSRGVGHGIASHYMRLASPTGKASEGHFGFRADSQEGSDYIADLNFGLQFALCNRREILQRVIQAINQHIPAGGDWTKLINRNHNHAVLREGEWIHRKGATHAETGMMGVIPGNMRDGSFIVRGLGNPESLWSSSHGAGRVLGRKEAKRVLEMDKFTDTMRGVTARVEPGTLDESPFAYKDIFAVMAAQSDLVEVLAHVKPIINIKG